MTLSKKIPKFYRQRFLLLLLEKLDGNMSKIQFQKLLFLTQTESKLSYYDFVPYKYGCFSFQAQSDIELLGKFGWLEVEENNITLLTKTDFNLSNDDAIMIEQTIKQFKRYSDQSLLNHVYKHYPYYAIYSKIADEVLDDTALYEKVNIEKRRLKSNKEVVYTIGYEGRSFESYVNSLIKQDIRLLCDTRRNPLSRKFGFSKGKLSSRLPNFDIEYIHLPELGINSEMRQELNSEEDYAKLFKIYRATLPQKADTLQLVEQLFKKHKRIALTCYEKKPEFCHRHCISDYLENKNNITTSHL